MKNEERVINVIHFDDDVFELESVSKELGMHYSGYKFNLISVFAVDQFKAEIELKEPDISLLDLHTEQSSETGISLAKLVQETWKGCRIIMRSSMDDEQTIESCLDAGADEFFSKNEGDDGLCLKLVQALG